MGPLLEEGGLLAGGRDGKAQVMVAKPLRSGDPWKHRLGETVSQIDRGIKGQSRMWVGWEVGFVVPRSGCNSLVNADSKAGQVDKEERCVRNES